MENFNYQIVKTIGDLCIIQILKNNRVINLVNINYLSNLFSMNKENMIEYLKREYNAATFHFIFENVVLLNTLEDAHRLIDKIYSIQVYNELKNTTKLYP